MPPISMMSRWGRPWTAILFAAILVAIVGLGIGRFINPSTEDQVHALGGITYHRWTGPKWRASVRDRTGFDFGFAPLVGVELTGNHVSDDDFLRLSLGDVEDLTLNCPRLSIRSIEGINRIRRLAELHISMPQVTDEWVRQIRGNESLYLLNLMDTDVTDGVADELAKFTKLRFLHVASTRVTAHGLVRLADIPTLESLTVDSEQSLQLTPDLPKIIHLRNSKLRIEVIPNQE